MQYADIVTMCGGWAPSLAVSASPIMKLPAGTRTVPAGHAGVTQSPPLHDCPAAHATVAYPCPSALHTCRAVVLAHTMPVPPGVHIHGVQTPTPRQAFIAGHAAVP